MKPDLIILILYSAHIFVKHVHEIVWKIVWPLKLFIQFAISQSNENIFRLKNQTHFECEKDID